MRNKPEPLLKDILLNSKKVRALACQISKQYPKFNSKKFISYVTSDLNNRELKGRIELITDGLEQYFPDNFEQSLDIIIKTLSNITNHNADELAGGFIYEPFNQYIARHGCTRERLSKSFFALEHITQHFSAEFAMRKFMQKFEKETLKQVLLWTRHKSHHVRRLASEGTRLNLPWGGKINVNPEKIIPILDALHGDSVRYVTRSVANSLNDITKDNPTLVIDTLKSWRKLKKQSINELSYISNHALRTLIKKGDPRALNFMGFNNKLEWKIIDSRIPKIVNFGNSAKFEFKIKLKEKGFYLIDYIIYFASKNNNLRSKVFKIKKHRAKENEIITINKLQHFKELTTRKIFPGEHAIAIQINGKKSKKFIFELK